MNTEDYLDTETRRSAVVPATQITKLKIFAYWGFLSRFLKTPHQNFIFKNPITIKKHLHFSLTHLPARPFRFCLATLIYPLDWPQNTRVSSVDLEFSYYDILVNQVFSLMLILVNQVFSPMFKRLKVSKVRYMPNGFRYQDSNI